MLVNFPVGTWLRKTLALFVDEQFFKSHDTNKDQLPQELSSILRPEER